MCKPKISVVMPVYQVEQYIGSAVRAICEQSYQDFELILVDDGTKDNSITVAKNILEQYQNIKYKIIKKSNGGLSSARNAGITAANGEWVICIDSDDTIHPNTLELLSKCIANDVDVVTFSYKYVDEPPVHYKNINNPNCYTYFSSEVAKKFFARNIKLIVPALMIKKEIFERNNLYYDEECKFSEDQLFTWQLLLSVNKIVYIDEEMYYYLVRENSIMTSSSVDKILTGYNKMLSLDQSISGTTKWDKFNINAHLILPRWVFGTLHTSAKLMDYTTFCMLEEKINLNGKINPLIEFNDMRIKGLILIRKISKKLFYNILRNI